MKAKKSLGQHFLSNRQVLEKIIAAANLNLSDTVLEVGPGTGNLTELLLEKAGKVLAIEKDETLITLLNERFSTKNKKLILISADILDHSAETLGLKNQNYKVVANLPYYLTGQFLRQFLGGKNQPQLAVLLLQKEVVERIVARNKKESLLSLSVKIFGTPHYVDTVRAGSFSPPPKVNSAILLIENIGREKLRGINEEKFFSMIKQGFAHKRKLLRNNLHLIEKDLLACHLKPKARAEDLSLEDWLSLTRLTLK